MQRGVFGVFSPIAIMVISFGSARAEPAVEAQQRCTAVYLTVAELTTDKQLQQRAKLFFSYAFDHVVARIGKATAEEQITKVVRQIGQDLTGQKLAFDPLLSEMKSCENIIAPP